MAQSVMARSVIEFCVSRRRTRSRKRRPCDPDHRLGLSSGSIVEATTERLNLINLSIIDYPFVVGGSPDNAFPAPRSCDRERLRQARPNDTREKQATIPRRIK